jgi:SSS family solute:Na+ symporter
MLMHNPVAVAVGTAAMILVSFLFFTGLVAAITWWLTRKDDHETSEGYFLAGRTLTWPLIAGSLLLTNLSTEQMVGLNGAAFTYGFSVMVWEVVAVLALVCMSLFFLPRFLKSGVSTVPQYLQIRFDHQTRMITDLIFLVAYAVILLPIILYTGATGLIGILDVQGLLGLQSHQQTLWVIVWLVGIIGSLYALFGGLRTVAVSDLLNGIGLLAGGLMITWFGLKALGGGSFLEGMVALTEGNEDRFNSIGGKDSSVPIGTVFSGVLLLNLFYWTTNQQIIQRTFGASSLAEGQKGVLATGFLKLLGPIYLVIPGMIAFAMFAGQDVRADHSYGVLVNTVLPTAYAGFFAAVMMGAILSSFNSALNSTCTLFSLGLYQSAINRNASNEQVVRSGKIFGWSIAIFSMSLAPLLAGQDSIFSYLQKMNGIYFIPIFSVVLVGMLTRRVPPLAAKLALVSGFVVIAAGYFVPPLALIVDSLNEFHFLGIVFAYLVVLMLIIGELSPLKEEWQQVDVKAVDMTPWAHARKLGAILVLLVLTIYVVFADLSVLA